MLAKYSDDHSMYDQNKQKLESLLNKNEKYWTQSIQFQYLRDQQNLKFAIANEREKIQFQFLVAYRVLVLIQAYLKLKDQYEDQENLQRLYPLKVKQHSKKIERHFNRIIVDSPNTFKEIEVEEEQINQENGYECIYTTAREDLIKLSVIV